MTVIPARVVETNDTSDSDSVEDNSEEELEVKSEDEDSKNEGDNEEEDECPMQSNLGWADSISKILRTNKPKKKKTLVLSKAKKLNEVKIDKAKPLGFQVATADGEIKEEKIEVRHEKDDEVKEPLKKKKRELPNLRKKPDILEKDRERTLSKIATRGVVQLFNAVKTQQKDISNKLKEAGPLEVRKEKVMKSIDKRAFLDVLMGEKSQNVDEVSMNNKNKKEESTWSVLKDDFMMGAKLKDWDKELEQESELEEDHEIEMESN